MTRPKPSHSGQAPTGLLKLNIRSLGSLKVMPSASNRFEKWNSCTPFGRVHLNGTHSPSPFEEGGLDRVGQPAHGVVLVRHAQPVDYQAHLRRIGQRIAGQQIFNRHEAALDLDPRETLLLPDLQLGLQVAPLGDRIRLVSRAKRVPSGKPRAQFTTSSTWCFLTKVRPTRANRSSRCGHRATAGSRRSRSRCPPSTAGCAC